MYVSFCKEHIIFKLLSNITKLLSCKEINIQDMHVLLSSVSCTKFPMSVVFFLPYTYGKHTKTNQNNKQDLDISLLMTNTHESAG